MGVALSVARSSTPGLGGPRLYMLFLWGFFSDLLVSYEEAECLVCFVCEGVRLCGVPN